ncbi:MAG: hypothetical protein H3C47_09180 [Candidatus Cloacimonetes bacterium]|nr:hypothetical protein [Candidatus Cloacimonadota bacterium]
MKASVLKRFLGKLSEQFRPGDSLTHRVTLLEDEVEHLSRLNRKLAFQVEILLSRQSKDNEEKTFKKRIA